MATPTVKVLGDYSPLPSPRPTTFDPQALRARVIRERHGFVTAEDVAALAGHPSSRLWPLLVRCGGCRFIAAAQDAAHLIAIITRDATDYVRDVSFPASEGGR